MNSEQRGCSVLVSMRFRPDQTGVQIGGLAEGVGLQEESVLSGDWGVEFKMRNPRCSLSRATETANSDDINLEEKDLFQTGRKLVGS